MTFTYDVSSPTDLERVRFHIADTDSDAPIFPDEVINFVISEEGSWQSASIALVIGLIQKLNREPDFQADWLRVDNKRALAGYRAMLAELRIKFGISASNRANVQYTHRLEYKPS